MSAKQTFKKALELPGKVEKYEAFVNDILKEDLRAELKRRDKLCERIAAYSQLKQTINCLRETDLSDGLRTQMDLGCNFYVQTHISDPSKIYVNIGLDIHVEMTLHEAVDFCEQKVKILNEDVSQSSKRTAKLKGKIKFVLLALQEIQGLDDSSQNKQQFENDFHWC